MRELHLRSSILSGSSYYNPPSLSLPPFHFFSARSCSKNSFLFFFGAYQPPKLTASAATPIKQFARSNSSGYVPALSFISTSSVIKLYKILLDPPICIISFKKERGKEIYIHISEIRPFHRSLSRADSQGKNSSGCSDSLVLYIRRCLMP
ncbi:hypothetical protein ABW19_dt0209164 [Dactylella cylindrospora]|nr:hypothetical protein ABW19_dt0209164 [Dactylella cylindrospora]